MKSIVLSWILGVGFVVLGGMCTSSVVDAALPRYQGARVRSGDALLNAQACAGEIGFDNHGACTAIVGVHARRAARAGMTIGGMARAYSAAIRRPRRLWVVRLRRDGRRPETWPSAASWSAHRDRWLALLAHVDAVLRGEVEDPCGAANVMHYGGPPGVDAALRGWDQIECVEDTRQRFYARGAM